MAGTEMSATLHGEPCSIALYVMYIRNKDCILFRFS